MSCWMKASRAANRTGQAVPLANQLEQGRFPVHAAPDRVLAPALLSWQT